MTENEKQVFEWTCKYCGKTIRSLYPRQLIELKKIHFVFCKVRKRILKARREQKRLEEKT